MMAGHIGSFLILLVILVVSFADNLQRQNNNSQKASKWNFINKTQLKECPDGIKPLKNVDKNRLLGVWFAYATTSIDKSFYRRRCASYNVQNSPYFNTNIIFTDYENLVITYSCIYNPKTKLNEVKLRVLTRTRTPMLSVLPIAGTFLHSIDFPMSKLVFLDAVAYCFEWYVLKYHQRPRPGQYAVPMNPFFEH
ncbi:uncharacterized protein LOC110182615 isoform X2 [Drosophila serrata]|uniref:uncharacterized protein LOC110182615 isoform X2 n=1 Tax=Drosophila serrata TaxID=7274 RepID=UPI000A1D3803|nr:uncharacterized protein LOC110182615 isoform X2 [Drosophila serrata]